jgi:hypothetical protein
MGSTSDERLNSIRTIAKELVEGALANCPRVGIEVPEILISDSTHGLGLTPNDSDQWLAATGLSTPHGFIASPLHRVVMSRLSGSRSVGNSEVEHASVLVDPHLRALRAATGPDHVLRHRQIEPAQVSKDP